MSVHTLWLRNYAIKGVDIVVTPQISPLGRFPEGGRNWESFGSDACLTGEFINLKVRGVRDNNLLIMTRRFIANEQERFPWSPEALGDKFVINDRLSANFDDLTMHESYLWKVLSSYFAVPDQLDA